MKGSQSWWILHALRKTVLLLEYCPFSPGWLSTHMGSPSSRCSFSLPCSAATVHVNLSNLLAPQMHVKSDIFFLIPPNPSLCDYLYVMRAVQMPNELKIHRRVCVCVFAKAHLRPKTSQCSNILPMATKRFWPTWPPTPKNEMAVMREQTQDVARRNDANGCLGEWYWVLHWDFVRRRS